MMSTYEMNDMGLLHYFLGIEVSQSKDGIFISQKKYAENILKKFNLLGCNSVATPLIANEKLKKEDGAKKADPTKYRSLIGGLLYLTATRSDIIFAASLLSRYMQEPSQIHFGAAKRVLRYLQGTLDHGILYKAAESSTLVGYTDTHLRRSHLWRSHHRSLPLSFSLLSQFSLPLRFSPHSRLFVPHPSAHQLHRVTLSSSAARLHRSPPPRRSARLQEVRELGEELEESDEEDGGEMDFEFESDTEGINEGYGEEEEVVS
ncbi:hypothetical protein ACLB2K_066039 [Fragaria x ananassa]